jgi:hypothetical protein
LKQKYSKPELVAYDEPVDALVYAIVNENMSEADTQLAMKRFADYFIDLNDLRVSRAEEIVDVLGTDMPATRETALNLTRTLASIFERYNDVSLKALSRMGKKPARLVLEKLNGASTFVVDYCMLTSLHGHAIPLTRSMLDYLRSKKLVHPNADDHQIKGFLTRQIPASSGFEFYALLRRESEKRRARKKKKTTRKKKTTTKTKEMKKKTKTRKRSK